MSFTIICNKCGEKELLDKDDYYDKDKISLENDRFDEPFEALNITCKKCKNNVSKYS